MHNPIVSFEKNVLSIKMLGEIHKYFSTQLHALDLSEILRAQYVLIISAFDCYIHDAVRESMVEMFVGTRMANNSFEKFKIPMSIVQQLLSTNDVPTRRQLISASIKKITSADSYQAPNKVENALQLIALSGIWTAISPEMGIRPQDIKSKLALIVNRRNKIAHEADIDPLTGDKIPIDRNDILDVLGFIEKLVYAIENRIQAAPVIISPP